MERALRTVNEEYGPELPRKPNLSLIRVQEHIAQMCLHTDTWGERELYHQWFFFDDLWASAHPDLANSLLRYDSRWDVLS